jgi:hypothetical protein
MEYSRHGEREIVKWFRPLKNASVETAGAVNPSLTD